MKLSFTTMATPNKSGPEAIRMAREFGYMGVDLRVSDHKGELKLNSSIQEINQIKDVFASEGIKPSGLLCYNETGSDEPESWKRMTESILRHLEIAERLGSPTIRIFGGNPRESGNSEDYTKRTADAIAAAIQRDDSKTGILIQNHFGNYSVKEALELIKKTGNDRLGLVFSPDHCIITEEPLSDLYSLVKPVTRQLYIADVIKTESDHDGTLPGKGCVPLNEAYEALGGDGFEGWVTFKWEKLWNPVLEEPEIALPYFIKYVNRFLKVGNH